MRQPVKQRYRIYRVTPEGLEPHPSALDSYPDQADAEHWAHELGGRALSDPELLSLAITATKTSVSQFARDYTTTAPRTIWRWLDGTSPLSKRMRAKCCELIGPTP